MGLGHHSHLENRKQFEQYTGDKLEFKKVNVEFHRGWFWAQNIFIYINDICEFSNMLLFILSHKKFR